MEEVFSVGAALRLYIEDLRQVKLELKWDLWLIVAAKNREGLRSWQNNCKEGVRL
jgi:hypothetical protein